MLGTLFSTPRSEPDHLLPAAGGTLVIALLLPVIALVGWSIEGWGLAALLWLGLHGLDLVLARVARSGNGRANPACRRSGSSSRSSRSSWCSSRRSPPTATSRSRLR